MRLRFLIEVFVLGVLARHGFYVTFTVFAILMAYDLGYHLRPARLRARRLLMRNLTFRQRWSFRLTGTLRTVGSDGHTYRILNLPSNNVMDRTVWETWCGAPPSRIPLADRVLGTKLLLETDAARYKRVALRRSL
jgi:hypothetical protein